MVGVFVFPVLACLPIARERTDVTVWSSGFQPVGRDPTLGPPIWTWVHRDGCLAIDI